MSKSVMSAVLSFGLVAMAVLVAIPARADDKPVKPKEMTAIVVEADTKANTLLVRKVTETMKVQKSFTVTAATKFTSVDGKAIALGDLKAGEKVTIDFTDHEKVLTATSVTVEPEHKK